VRIMAANEHVRTYAHKIVHAEIEIAARLMRLSQEDDNDKRASLRRDIVNLRAMLAVFTAAKLFFEKLLLTDQEMSTSDSGESSMNVR
jgi:hypothetical protein